MGLCFWYFTNHKDHNDQCPIRPAIPVSRIIDDIFSSGRCMRKKNKNHQNPAPMKRLKNLIFLSVSLLFLFAACKKEEQNTPAPPAEDTFTDPRDGQTYQIVTIGKEGTYKSGDQQVWFAENLNYETAASWWYENNADTGDIYGRLYTWDAAMQACPAGWHLPSDEEWKTLEMNLGMSKAEADDDGPRGTDTGAKLKVSGSDYWGEYNAGATNSSGFSALPAGNRDNDFFGLRASAYWWTSTVYDDFLELSWSRSLSFVGHEVERNPEHISFGFSVRCIKDE